MNFSGSGSPAVAYAFVKVAVAVPVYGYFDYRWTLDSEPIIGGRVSVPFGRRNLMGIIVERRISSDVAADKLRTVIEVHDHQALLTEEMLRLLEWASQYYHYPVGEVLSASLPSALRKGAEATIKAREGYRWIGPHHHWQTELKHAPAQLKLARFLVSSGEQFVASDALAGINKNWRQPLQALVKRHWVSKEQSLRLPASSSRDTAVVAPLSLTSEQHAAVERVVSQIGTASRFLIDGVTGSGKTEVYLRCLEAVRQRGLQSLVLVPEISLTPQLMQRFQQRLGGNLVCLHSGLNETERSQNWLIAAKGYADVVIGTRSSILVPLPRLGLIVIDEEHDSSFKQQDGFRYHARDLAIMRAHQAKNCLVVLGTATPSFESLRNVELGKIESLMLSERAAGARAPQLALVDIRRGGLVEGMSNRLIDAIRTHLGQGGQVMVFINRRGYSPTLLCNDCGAVAECLRCDSRMTVHEQHRRLRCHYCGAERPIPSHCESCGSEQLDKVGHGTERIANALQKAFPDAAIGRVDRDSTRRRGALESMLSAAAQGELQILVGTQMLAKGHHFPNLSLVGVLDADRGLYGSDFRSLEHMGQLILQVAGRAGRESRAGEVLIQTRNPDNPILQTLIHQGYAAFAELGMQERQIAGLPPYGYIALLRAESKNASKANTFLSDVARNIRLAPIHELDVLGPAPAPMERLAGQFRAQLLLQANRRKTLNECLRQITSIISELPSRRSCRWSIDVDPVDLF